MALRVGILGCGAIGREIATFAQSETAVESILVHDAVAENARSLVESLDKARMAETVAKLIEGADVIVEAASQGAVRDHLGAILGAGRDVILFSLGALVDDAFRDEAERLANENGAKIYLPSGAVAAVDALRAGSMTRIHSVTLVTTKPPAALGVKADKWTVVFDGAAREAVAKFPQNVNVAACLAIAGIGFDRTRVQVVADPLATRNEHKVIFEGDFGRVRCEIENVPSPDNPRTSWLASLAGKATLKRLLQPWQIGT